MPGRNYHKAEAKYNVTTDFPSLGLHSAAATGNLGLVEYALVHGQPVNSVLDGVLPLHAACAGGHIQVVKLLIERGADVNAPRLPRRYSNDKNRDSSAPIVGSSGSTPLHFAAANGNTNVITLLLLHGAHADRPDKHGITPEMLAKQHGWLECAEVLREWALKKDRDLKQRETNTYGDVTAAPRTERSRDVSGSFSGVDGEIATSASTRRRLQVKHSIDTALNMFKSSSATIDSHKPSSRHSVLSNTPPASPIRPSADNTSNLEPPTQSGRVSPDEHGSCRPSLPQLLQAPRSGKTSNPTFNTPSVISRRPRSAGTDAERDEREVQGTIGRNASGRRLGSKYSLMNMFKKAHGDSPTHVSGSTTPDFRPGSSPKQGLMVQNTSSHVIPSNVSVPGQPAKSLECPKEEEICLRSRARLHAGSDASMLSQSRQSSPRSIAPIERLNSTTLDEVQEDNTRIPAQKRIFSDGNRDTLKPGSSPVSMLSMLRTKDSNRQRSGSNGSQYSTHSSRHIASLNDEIHMAAGNGDGSTTGLASRPGILRAHSRSSSGEQGTALSTSYRALRFEYSLNDTDNAQTIGLVHGLRSVNSAGSLARFKTHRGTCPTNHRENRNTTHRDASPMSAPAGINNFDLSTDSGTSSKRTLLCNGKSVPSSSAILTARSNGSSHRKRDQISSLSSSSESSLPAIASNEGLVAEGNDGIGQLASSFGTPSCPVSRASKSQSISGTPAVPFPGGARSLPDKAAFVSKIPVNAGLHKVAAVTNGFKARTDVAGFNGLSAFEIDINSISSHAQAEALVQRTQQEILELGEQEVLLSSGITGHTPLSARLAAYGESLALERRLREEMEKPAADHPTKEAWQLSPSASSPHDRAHRFGPNRNRLDRMVRQHSLDDRLGGRRERYRQLQFQNASRTKAAPDEECAYDDEVYSRPATALGYTHQEGLQPTDLHPEPLFCREDFGEGFDEIGPMDGLEPDLEFYSPLYHVPATTMSGSLPTRSRIEQVRNAKLTKMGFSPNEQRGRIPPAQTKLFGGLNLKNLMQTFKGRA
ncbi:hypothetical protein AX17_005735 [Amanita inopinata Kibby_2008]|nr:hypothetical protein AX17_005735 [Amanita inopinata Kibby_2008]